MAEPSKAIKMLGGFELITKIGQGGMGTVFRARQISLDRDVALKILPPQIAQRDPVFIERFIREARTSAKLNHQNIVQGIEVGKDDETGLYYFAMEFIDGVTIKALLKKDGVIAEKRALEIAMGVTQALICAHRAGIVHRDIKPDNILLNSRNEPKLADLGLARQALDSNLGEGPGSTEIFGINMSKNSDLTQAGSALGTPSYMAPEQIKAEMDKIDARTDLYQLGATLYHMVTGKAPYTAANSREVMMMHLTAAVPEPRAANPAVSEAVSRMIVRLMQKEHVKRYQSAEELAKEIDRILNGAPAERLRRGSGKQLAIHGSGKQSPVGERKPPTGDHSANRAHGSADPAGAKLPRVTTRGVNKKMILAAAGAAVCAIAGIVYAFSGRSLQAPRTVASGPAAGAEKHAELNGKPTPGVPATNTVQATDTAPGAPVGSAPEVVEKWEPFDKASKIIAENPQNYAANLKLLDEAAKGAPYSVVPAIRSLKMKQDRERDAAFRKVMDDVVKKARETVGGGKADFAGALSLLQESALPANLLSDPAKQELAKVRGEFEAQTAAAFNGSVDNGLKRDIEKAESLSRIQEIQQRFPTLAQTYPVKAVRDRLDEFGKQAAERIKAINAALSQSQGSIFCRSVDTAYALAKTGEYNDAIKALMKIHSDPAIAERYGSQSEILKHDVETLRDMVKKATDVLDGKLSSKDDVLLHPLGGAVTGKITAKESGGTYTFSSQDIGEQSIEASKLDAWDLLALSGARLEGAERKELLGICYFWQGKPQKAYEYFAQVKKESSEGSDAGIYMSWMNTRASELIARMTENYRECRDNASLSADDKKTKQAESQALLARLKTEFSTTEAYLARKQKK